MSNRFEGFSSAFVKSKDDSVNKESYSNANPSLTLSTRALEAVLLINLLSRANCRVALDSIGKVKLPIRFEAVSKDLIKSNDCRTNKASSERTTSVRTVQYRNC